MTGDRCPMCGDVEPILLGTLARLTWLRCRSCGWEYHDNDEEGW